MIDFADGQLTDDDNKDLVGANGNALYRMPDMFGSQDENPSALALNLFYDNEGFSDGADSQLGGFRHNYSATMDDVPVYYHTRYGNVEVWYSSTPQDACTYSWSKLKNFAYRRFFVDGVASYNAQTQLCEIAIDGVVKLKLPVFRGTKESLTTEQYNSKPYHIVTRGNGVTYLFLRDSNGLYKVMGSSQVKLERVGDTWKFTDRNDQVDTFDLSGKLLQMDNQGKIITLSYDNNSRLAQVRNSFGEGFSWITLRFI